MTPKQTGKPSQKKEAGDSIGLSKKVNETSLSLENLVNILPEAVITTDIQTHITGWNAAAERIYGWKAAEVLGKPIEDFLHTQYQSTNKDEAIAGVIENGQWFNTVTQLRKDGARIPVISSVSVIKDDAGEPVGYVGINRDYTREAHLHESALKTAEDTLRKSQSMLMSVLDAAPDAMVVINNKGEIILADRQVEAVFGYSQSELVGQSLQILVPERFRTMHTRYEQNFFITPRHRADSTLELFALRKDGTEFPAEININHHKVGGEIVAIASVQDITERKKVEEKLQASERKNRALFDQYHDAVFILDLQGNHLDVNQRAADMLGYTREELFGLSINELSAEPEKSQSILDRVLKGERLPVYERLFRCKNGDLLPTEINVELVRDEEGNPLHIQSVVRDITSRKQAEEQIEALARFPAENQSPVMRCSTDGKLLYANSASAPLLDLWGCSEGGFLPLDWRKKITAAYDGNSHNTLDVETEGQVFSTRITPIAGKGYVNIYATDITDRKRAELELTAINRNLQELAQSLEESHNMLELIIESAPIRVFWKDGESRYLGCNSLFARDAGLANPAEIIGKRDNELIWKDKANEFRQQELQIIETGIPKMNKVEIQATPDGGSMWINVSMVPLKGTGGEVIGTVGIYEDISERKQTEEQLQKSQSLLMKSQNIAKLGSWELDLMTGELYWSDEIYRIFEVSRDEFKASYESFLNFIHPDDREKVDTTYWSSVRDRTPYSVEHRLLFPDGRIKIVHEIGETTYNGHGEPLRSVGTVQDVTERKQAEEALQMETERFRHFANSNIIGVVIADASGKITLANDYYLNLLGVTREDFNDGKVDWRKFTPPEWLPVDEKALAELNERGICEPYEKEYIRADGTRVPVYIADAMLPGAKKEIAAFVLDFTERKQAETALRVSEENYRSLAETSDSAIAVLDREGMILYANPTSLRVWGDTDIIGKTVFDIYPPEYATRYLPFIQKVIDEQVVDLNELETPINGKMMWFQVSMSPIKNSNGPVNTLLLNAWDITERKQAEEALKESEERFSTAFFTSPVSQSIITQETSEVLAVNDACCILFGYSREELIGANTARLNLWENPTDRLSAVEELQRTGRLLPRETTVKKKSGEKCTVIVEIAPIAWKGIPCYISTIFDITDRKRAEQALRENEAFISAVLENLPIGIAVNSVDPAVKFTYMNDNFPKLYRTTKEELSGMDAFWEVVYEDPTFREEIKKRVLDDIASGDVKRMMWVDIPLTRAGEETTFITARNIPFPGRPMMISTVWDVTERKQAETALKTSEERLRLTLQTTSDGFWIVDFDGKFLEVNNAYCQMSGYSREELLQMSISDVEAIENFQSTKKHIAKVRHESHDRFETRHRHKDGTKFDVEMSVNLLDEKAKLLICFCRDITKRKQAEEALQISEKRYRTVIENQTEFIVRWKPDGTRIFANEAYLRFFGLSADPIDTTHFMNLVSEEDRPAVQEKLSRLTSGVHSIETDIHRVIKPDGAIAWQEWTDRAIHDQAGQLVEFQSIGRDITERKQAEEHLKNSQERLLEAQQLAHLGNWEWDLKTNNLFWSDEVFHIFGLPPTEFTPTAEAFENAIHPEDRADFMEQRTKMLKEKRAAVIDHRITLPGGEVRHVQERTQLIVDEKDKVSRVIGTVQDITDRKLAERGILQRTEDLLLINTLNDAANRGEPIETIIEIFARETRKMLGCQDSAIYLISPDEKHLEMQSTTLSASVTEQVEKIIGIKIPRIKIPIRPGSHIEGLIAKKEGTLTNDPAEIQKWIQEFTETTFLPPTLQTAFKKLIPHIFRALKINAVISIPLVSSSHTIGLLDMSTQGQFTPEDLQRVRLLSHQLTAVILRKQAEGNVHIQLKRITALNEIDRAISASLDMSLSLDVLLNEVLSQLGVDAASILLLDPVNQALEYVAGKGFRTPAIRESHLRVGEGLAGHVGLERRAIHVPDLHTTDIPLVRVNLFKNEEFKEYFGVPLIAKGLLKGVLEIFNRSPLTPDPDWMHYLETLGGQAAIAVDNAQLFENMQRSNQELVTAYDATITGWSRALDLRDKETEGHTLRVTELTEKLARRMGLSQQELVHIRRGSLLHDIGKLGIPDHILLKPGKLTDEEWQIMRQHPTQAFEMLLPIKYLRPALDIPYCHHEKWDGSGYPRGLKGEHIPLAARIFAVVDVWDALRSDRPYRSSWSPERVREYIREQSGEHFDPQVAKEFLKMMDELPE